MKNGSAYIMVILICFAIFLILSGAMAVALNGRKITRHYAHYSGNYDLAVSGNERSFFMVKNALQQQQMSIEAAVTDTILLRIADGSTPLMYRGGAFWISNNDVRRSFENNMKSVINSTLFDFSFNWMASAAYALDAETVTDIFTAETTLKPQGSGYALNTRINKSGGNPAEAGAELVWSISMENSEEFIPTKFTWRNAPPVRFTVGLVESPPGGVTDVSFIPKLHGYGDIILLTGDAVFHRSVPGAALVIHDGPSVAVSGDMEALIISYGEVTLDDAFINGGVWAEKITVNDNVSVIPHENLIFNLDLPPLVLREVYDFLKLTQFSPFSVSPRPLDMVLGELDFAKTGENRVYGEILLNNFDDYAPRMVKSKKIAD